MQQQKRQVNIIYNSDTTYKQQNHHKANKARKIFLIKKNLLVDTELQKKEHKSSLFYTLYTTNQKWLRIFGSNTELPKFISSQNKLRAKMENK